MPGQQPESADRADTRPAAPLPTQDGPDSALIALVRYLARAAAESDYRAERAGAEAPQAEPEGPEGKNS
jgi:hypothetical protein